VYVVQEIPGDGIQMYSRNVISSDNAPNMCLIHRNTVTRRGNHPAAVLYQRGEDTDGGRTSSTVSDGRGSGATAHSRG